MTGNPNILLIMCDQLRAFETGCYGNQVIRTPNIDQLAQQGIRFETAVTNYPVCMAARSVLLSGQYNRQCTGGVGNVGGWMEGGALYMPQYPVSGRPHLKDPTLAEVLRQAGYSTTVIGKWHIHSWPDDLGFDQYLITRVHHCHTGQHYTWNGNPEFIAPGYSVDYECGRVLEFLRSKAHDEKPFFLFYSISPPHCPLSDAPQEYLTMYPPEEVPIRPNVDLNEKIPEQEYWFNVYRWDFRYYNFRLPYTLNLPEDYTLQRVIAEYYGLTTWVDDVIGRVLSALEVTNLADDTIVLFTSDHGDYLGSHGRVQKGDLHEEAIRIPLILRWQKGLSPGVIRSHVSSLVDIMPTLLGLAAVEVPDHVQGSDFSSLLTMGAGVNLPEAAYIETGSGVGIRTLRTLYALPFKESSRGLEENPHYYFDLGEDPYQLANMAPLRLSSERAASLDQKLRQWDVKTPWMQAENI
jgi:arylsulfatase A-like enzyme